MKHLNTDIISCITYSPEKVSESWKFKLAKKGFKILWIPIIKARPNRWESPIYGDYDTKNDTAIPQDKMFEENPHLYYNGVKIMVKAKLVVRLVNRDEYTLAFDSNETAIKAREALEETSSANFISIGK